jgi:excisionase family DNA binding protein
MSIDEAIRQAVREELREALKSFRAPAPATPDELLSVERAAELADVSKATIRRWVEQGLLKRYGSGRALRVRRDEVLSVRPPELEDETDPDAIALKLLKEK